MRNFLRLSALTLVIGAVIAPTTANAQVWRREETANEWKNIATISGALGLLGFLNHDDTLTFAGAAGALYSSYRYNEDRKSINREYRARAAYFDRDYFYRDGCRYEKRTVWKNGTKYYQFVNVDYNNRGRDWDRDEKRRWEEERRAEQRRIDEQRRREEQWRREEQRRRDEERRREEACRREEQKRRDEERRERERWEREHRNRDSRSRDWDRDRDRDRDRRDHRDH